MKNLYIHLQLPAFQRAQIQIKMHFLGVILLKTFCLDGFLNDIRKITWVMYVGMGLLAFPLQLALIFDNCNSDYFGKRTTMADAV